MIYATLNLAYSQKHIYYMLLIYSMILLFWNLLCSSVTNDCVTMTCDSL